MNPMVYPQQYPAAQGMQFNQIVRRALTDAERQLPGRVYKMVQKGLRGIAAVCLILFVFNSFILPAMITDAITLDSISTTLYVFMFVMGAMAFGLSVNALVVRKRIEDAMRDGTAIEVTGPAYRTSAVGKIRSWTVGPVSLLPTRDVEGLLQEGMPTSVLCLPRLKAAIAINNYGLRQGARIMFPPNLEAMAVPVGPIGMPAFGQPAQAAYPAYGAPVPQGPPPQGGYGEELPPPPPPD